VVALSGGADSACVLSLAATYLGRNNVQAATCINSHMFSYDLENAKRIAEFVDVEHIEFTASMPEEFYKGDATRCYHCKKAIMSEITGRNYGIVIFDGTNADDDPSERPGSAALPEFGIISPLKELNLGKTFVKDYVGRHMDGLTFHNESCKASRLSGEINEHKMQMVESFEGLLRDRLPGVRYRIDEGYVEFKKPVKITTEEFILINSIKNK